MRILHVVGSLAPRHGGPSTSVPQMCAALAARGHHVELLTTDDDGPERLDVELGSARRVDGVWTTYYPVRWPRSFGTSPQLAAALLRRVGGFDVVHVHSLYLFHGLVACAAARRRRVPYFVRPHGTLNPYHRAIRRGRKAAYTFLVERRNLERATGVHCTSDEEQSHVVAAFPLARTFVIPLGVTVPDTVNGSGDSFRAQGRRLVTFLGRLTEKKRPILLVEAFARVAAEDPTAYLVFAGPDDERLGPIVAERARELGLGGRVSLLGPLDRSEVWQLLECSAVFVLPSADENFGVAAAEALACGVPVVVTRGVAIHGEIGRWRAGVVAEASPDALGVAIRTVLEDPGVAERMGANGRALAQELFGWDAIAARLEEVYRGSGA